MKLALVTIRALTIVGCLSLVFSGRYPPADAQDREDEAVQAEKLRELDTRVTNNSALANKQWDRLNNLEGQLNHIQGIIETVGGGLTLLAVMGITLQVRKEKS